MTTIDPKTPTNATHPDAPSPAWTAEDSASLYGVRAWGEGYFSVTPEGTVGVRPDKSPNTEIDLHDIVNGLRARGIATPVLLRFTDVLRTRLRRIHSAFARAIEDNAYTAEYTCVYPIKVNQQRQVCEEIRDIGGELGFGLEAGSKPELLAVLGLTVGDDDMPIVCNGFKDDEYVETVVLATKLGRRIIPVVERAHELELIIKHAKAHDVRPNIGMRIKPSTVGSGRWESSGGMRSKFGLHPSELLTAVDRLREADMLDCFRLVHFHVGSQLCDIRQMKHAISELARTYAELRRLGATNLDMIDVGGGLGVDYDGSQSTWASSVNYTVEEYASDVVYRIKSVCDDAGVPHPTIVSESGRAMVSYSSVLVTDVLGRAEFAADPDIDRINASIEAEDETPQPIIDLSDAFERRNSSSLNELYHDASSAHEEALSLYSMGYISLPMRAAADRLFWAIGQTVLTRAHAEGEDACEAAEDLPAQLSDIYFCNFSLFQSLPDSWAIEQVFPICPIHRLNEAPTRRAILADITCDSDGKVDQFASPEDGQPAGTLMLHDLREGERYDLGIFLVGAYQEVLGDLHNLFGDTHAVHISIDDDANWSIDEIVEGDTVREVLEYVQFDTERLRRSIRRNIEQATRRKTLTVEEGRLLLAFYEDGLKGYTYLE